MKEKTTVGTVVGFKIKELGKGNRASVLLLDTDYLILNDNLTKKHTYRAKGGIVEESKKGYTGDALALRGDEGRDKLR